jgi:hypothetical protein
MPMLENQQHYQNDKSLLAYPGSSHLYRLHLPFAYQSVYFIVWGLGTAILSKHHHHHQAAIAYNISFFYLLKSQRNQSILASHQPLYR